MNGIFSSFFCWAKSNIEMNSVILCLPYEIQKKMSNLEFKTFFELLFKIITIHHHYFGNTIFDSKIEWKMYHFLAPHYHGCQMVSPCIESGVISRQKMQISTNRNAKM